MTMALRSRKARAPATDNTLEVSQLIEQERDALMATWRGAVREFLVARSLDRPTLDDHIPGLLEELATALRCTEEHSIAECVNAASPPAHGLQRLHNAFDIEEVVAEYNILRGSIHDLAEARGVELQGKPFRVINRVMDQAIGSALQAYSGQRAAEIQKRRDEYLAFIAHDLRTPLNAISLVGSALEVMLTVDAANAEIGRMLLSLRRNLRQLEALVSKVLEENTNLRSEDGIKLERREFDLWPLVQALIRDRSAADGSGGTALINRVSPELMVYADAGMLRRVLQNLIDNAVRYTPHGSVIIDAWAGDTPGALECSVADDGAGIPARFLDNIFDKGASDPQHADGTGLGLAIVKTFVEAHAGTVLVESKEGVGTTFRITLPGRDADPRH